MCERRIAICEKKAEADSEGRFTGYYGYFEVLFEPRKKAEGTEDTERSEKLRQRRFSDRRYSNS